MQRSGTRVVIADLQEIFRAGLRAILDASSLVVVAGEAGTAEEAVDHARKRQPEVILLEAAL